MRAVNRYMLLLYIELSNLAEADNSNTDTLIIPDLTETSSNDCLL